MAVDFNFVYHEHKKLVYNLALNYLQNESDAQDVTQEIFIKIYNSLEKYNPDLADIKTWIYRIAVTKCLDFIKAKKTKRRFGTIVSLFKTDSNETIDELSFFSHPGILLEDKEELQNLLLLINKLPDNQKTVLLLTKIEERPQKEVAEIMMISLKAVESLLQRAKQNLKKNLKF